ncbi:MAG: hypothetical protein QXH26_04525 [Candidatus Hadarchaeales archaeon]
MERGLADILTLCFIFAALVSSTTLLLLWADLPLRQARERQTQLRCQLLYFALTNFRPENSLTTLPLAAAEKLLGIREWSGLENSVLEVLRFCAGGPSKVSFQLENGKLEITSQEAWKSSFWGRLSLFPAWENHPLQLEMEVKLG